MKIALYYPWIYLTSGAERTILRLVQESRHDWVLFTNHFEPENTFPGFKECRVVELSGISVERSVVQTALTCWKILRQRLPIQDFDAVVVFCEGVGDLTLFRNHDKPAINICLTPLRIAFDEEYQKRYLEKFPIAKWLVVKAGAAIFRAVDRMVWRHYSKIFCISNEVKRRVVNGGLAAPDDIEILYPCLGFHPVNPKPVYHPFFLLPGRIMWTKNIELGILAFQRFRAQNSGFGRFRLVVAGIVDEKSRPYFARLKSLTNGDPDIEFRVFPSDDELAGLYRTCYATLFTAFNEDYGIVPLEGMAYGKPVIAVNRGGPLDTVQHGVQGFLEEPDPASFAQRMTELALSEELTRRMGAAGLEHSRKFNWENFARRVDDALEAISSTEMGSLPLKQNAPNLDNQAAINRVMSGGDRIL
jgi:glycosyltransferase involved in cell wall biosynthesis